MLPSLDDATAGMATKRTDGPILHRLLTLARQCPRSKVGKGAKNKRKVLAAQGQLDLYIRDLGISISSVAGNSDVCALSKNLRGQVKIATRCLPFNKASFGPLTAAG